MDGFLFYTLTALVTISEAIVIVVLMYYYCVSIFGWQKIEEEKDLTPTKRFALLTAAHNEEAVIRYHLESMKKLDYPQDMYDIYIIADNCTDTTAEIARSEGVKVFERFSPDRGKGFAVEWMLNELFKMENKNYDAVCLFDADNLVSSNFLSEMGAKLKQGFKSIQVIWTLEPERLLLPPVATYWSMNRMRQLARYNLGLSSPELVSPDYEVLWLGCPLSHRRPEFTMRPNAKRYQNRLSATMPEYMMKNRYIFPRLGNNAPAGCRDTGMCVPLYAATD